MKLLFIILGIVSYVSLIVWMVRDAELVDDDSNIIDEVEREKEENRNRYYH